MTPRRQLIAIVALAALVIGVAWAVLYRKGALTPPAAPQSGPSLSEIGEQFEANVKALRKLTDQQGKLPPVASDDLRLPAPSSP